MLDIITGVSVLLIFLTVLLTALDKEVNDKINKTKPPKADQKTANGKFNNNLIVLLLLIATPVLLIYFVTFWSLLPKTLTILKTSSFSIWNFNELKTIFVFIEIGLLGLTVFALMKFIQLLTKIYSTT